MSPTIPTAPHSPPSPPLRRWAPIWVTLTAVLAACAGSAPPAPESTASASAVAPQTVPPAESVAASQALPSFPAVSLTEPLFVTQPDATLHLLLVRPDGTGGQEILTQLPGEQVHPDWSPDGSQLAFEHYPDGQDGDVLEVWISDANGDNAQALVHDYPADLDGLFWANPAWSPDGNSIAMVGYAGNPSRTLPSRSVVVIVDTASRELSIAADVPIGDAEQLLGFPRWAPDATELVVAVSQFSRGVSYTGEAIAVIRQDGTDWMAPEVITPFDDFACRPDWHPVEDLIVFGTHDVGAFNETDEASNLFTIRPDGSQLAQLTTFAAGEERASQPSWTPDGRIIFTHVSGADDGQRHPAFINADGSGLEVLTGVAGTHSRVRPGP